MINDRKEEANRKRTHDLTINLNTNSKHINIKFDKLYNKYINNEIGPYDDKNETRTKLKKKNILKQVVSKPQLQRRIAVIKWTESLGDYMAWWFAHRHFHCYGRCGSGAVVAR